MNTRRIFLKAVTPFTDYEEAVVWVKQQDWYVSDVHYTIGRRVEQDCFSVYVFE